MVRIKILLTILVKKWSEKNKVNIKNYHCERNKQKVECEVCHKTLTFGSLKRHLKNIHSV